MSILECRSEVSNFFRVGYKSAAPASFQVHLLADIIVTQLPSDRATLAEQLRYLAKLVEVQARSGYV